MAGFNTYGFRFKTHGFHRPYSQLVEELSANIKAEAMKRSGLALHLPHVYVIRQTGPNEWIRACVHCDEEPGESPHCKTRTREENTCA